MQNLIDTRVLKKAIKYLAVWCGIIVGSIASMLGLMWISIQLFDSFAPLTILLFTLSIFTFVYMMAKEKVDAERREEQRLVDQLIRDAKRAEENAQIEAKYGIKVTP